jgi:hypothetical protein
MANVQARRKQHAEDTGATAAQLQSVPHALNVKKKSKPQQKT